MFNIIKHKLSSQFFIKSGFDFFKRIQSYRIKKWNYYNFFAFTYLVKLNKNNYFAVQVSRYFVVYSFVKISHHQVYHYC